jgi:hypothetical protein
MHMMLYFLRARSSLPPACGFVLCLLLICTVRVLVRLPASRLLCLGMHVRVSVYVTFHHTTTVRVYKSMCVLFVYCASTI